MTPKHFIGIDGGATKVSAGLVSKNENNFFTLDSKPVSVTIRACPSFSSQFYPVSMDTQLDEQSTNSLNLSIEEERQGIAYAEACESALSKINAVTPLKDVPIGIGMPGIKTENKSGISVMNNGPRMPRFLDVLNRRLSMAEFPIRQITILGDDNYYCGLGEIFSEKGSLKNATNALYIGGGTGVADAIVLDEKLVNFETVQDRLKKTWEIMQPNGQSLESLISQKGLMEIKANTLNMSVDQLIEKGLFPEVFLQDDLELAESFASNLSWLIHFRLATFGEMFSQKVFDKIVLGQRLGHMLNSNDSLWTVVQEKTRNRITDSSKLNPKIKDHYLNSDFLILSLLTEAPIIGAAAAASESC